MDYLNLLKRSPIQELTDKDLSYILNQLSCTSEDLTERNIEDLLREVEELTSPIVDKPQQLESEIDGIIYNKMEPSNPVGETNVFKSAIDTLSAVSNVVEAKLAAEDSKTNEVEKLRRQNTIATNRGLKESTKLATKPIKVAFERSNSSIEMTYMQPKISLPGEKLQPKKKENFKPHPSTNFRRESTIETDRVQKKLNKPPTVPNALRLERRKTSIEISNGLRKSSDGKLLHKKPEPWRMATAKIYCKTKEWVPANKRIVTRSVKSSLMEKNSTGVLRTLQNKNDSRTETTVGVRGISSKETKQLISDIKNSGISRRRVAASDSSEGSVSNKLAAKSLLKESEQVDLRSKQNQEHVNRNVMQEGCSRKNVEKESTDLAEENLNSNLILQFQEKLNLIQEKYSVMIEKLTARCEKLEQNLPYRQETEIRTCSSSTSDVGIQTNVVSLSVGTSTEPQVPLNTGKDILENYLAKTTCQSTSASSSGCGDNTTKEVAKNPTGLPPNGRFLTVRKNGPSVPMDLSELYLDNDFVPWNNQQEVPEKLEKVPVKNTRDKLMQAKAKAVVASKKGDIGLLATIRSLQSELDAIKNENRRIKVKQSSVKPLNDRLLKSVVRTTIGTQTFDLAAFNPAHYNTTSAQESKKIVEENKVHKMKLIKMGQELRALQLRRAQDLKLLQDKHEEEVSILIQQKQILSKLLEEEKMKHQDL